VLVRDYVVEHLDDGQSFSRRRETSFLKRESWGGETILWSDGADDRKLSEWGAFLAYISRRDRNLIDRRLYH